MLDDHRPAMPQVTAMDDQFGTHALLASNSIHDQKKDAGAEQYNKRDALQYRSLV